MEGPNSLLSDVWRRGSIVVLIAAWLVIAGCQQDSSLVSGGSSPTGNNPVATPPSASPTPAVRPLVSQTSGTGDLDSTFSSRDAWTLEWTFSCAGGAPDTYSIEVAGSGSKRSGSATAPTGWGRLSGNGATASFHVAIRTRCQWQITVRG